MEKKVQFLRAIRNLGGRAGSREVAEYLGLTLKSVSGKLGAAWKAGLLYREEIPATWGAGRSYLYSLSPTGQRILEAFEGSQAWASLGGFENPQDIKAVKQAQAWGPDLGQFALLALGGWVLWEMTKEDEDE